MSATARESRYPMLPVMWVMCFFLGLSPGFWGSALTNILNAKGLGEWVTLAFMVTPCAALVSPLVAGALADQRIRAERLLGIIALSGAGLLLAAFWTLDHGWNPWWFIGFLALHAIFAGPMWGLGTMIALTHLRHGERTFPLARMGGTVGWMVAGLATSYLLNGDRTVSSGYASVISRVLLGLLAFTLPATPPTSTSRSWTSLLGLEAFGLLKERDHFVFFFTTALLSVPMSAFYMFVPRHLEALGDLHASGTMTLGQWSEVGAMVLVGAVMARCRVKTVLVWALGLTLARFLCFTVAGATSVRAWLIAGVSLHGIAYTFYFITAQIFLDRRVPPGLRGQAQGLLTLASSGVGTLTGTMFVGYLYRLTVIGGTGGWEAFWAVLSSILLLCLILFSTLYKGIPLAKERE
ncbi:MAG: MFS transporter [Luteolibacter sp.]